jgi:DNA-binding NarL/FixJ family response regulator
MRGQSQFKSLPIVVFTSSKNHLDISRAYSAGANAYLVKTPDFDEFTRMMEVFHRFWIEYNHAAQT